MSALKLRPQTGEDGLMPRFRKDVLKVDRYSVLTPDGKGRRVVEYTPADLKEMHDNYIAQKAVSDVYAPPFCAEHQDDAVPRSLAERMASKVFGHLGYTEDVQLSEDGNELVFVLDTQDEEAAKIAERIKWVSPEIRTDWKDGHGRVWPGKTITHVAATSRPVQVNQKPFQRLSHNIIRLSLADRLSEDTTVANEVDEGTEGKAGPDMKKVLEALAILKVTLPDDTTMENLTDRLIGAAAVTKSGSLNNLPPEEEVTTEEPVVLADSPVMMSLTKRVETLETQLKASEADRKAARGQLEKAHRKDLERRILELRSSFRVNKPIQDKLLTELKTVRLALTDIGELGPSNLVAKVEAYEDLDPVQLGHGTPTPVPDPEEEAAKPDDHVMHQLTGGRWAGNGK